MATESGENLNFPPLHKRLLYHPVGQKFARNRSISYGFRDIDTFPFSAKIQDAVFAPVKNECETDCLPSLEKARQL